jgi:hypothetical protein
MEVPRCLGIKMRVLKRNDLLWLRRGDSSRTQRRGTSAVGNRHQRTGEKIADREGSLRAVVNCRMLGIELD